MSGFVPFVSSSPPPMDHGDGSDDDDFGGFESASVFPATSTRKEENIFQFRPIAAEQPNTNDAGNSEMVGGNALESSNFVAFQAIKNSPVMLTSDISDFHDAKDSPNDEDWSDFSSIPVHDGICHNEKNESASIVTPQPATGVELSSGNMNSFDTASLELKSRKETEANSSGYLQASLSSAKLYEECISAASTVDNLFVDEHLNASISQRDFLNASDKLSQDVVNKPKIHVEESSENNVTGDFSDSEEFVVFQSCAPANVTEKVTSSEKEEITTSCYFSEDVKRVASDSRHAEASGDSEDEDGNFFKPGQLAADDDLNLNFEARRRLSDVADADDGSDTNDDFAAEETRSDAHSPRSAETPSDDSSGGTSGHPNADSTENDIGVELKIPELMKNLDEYVDAEEYHGSDDGVCEDKRGETLADSESGEVDQDDSRSVKFGELVTSELHRIASDVSANCDDPSNNTAAEQEQTVGTADIKQVESEVIPTSNTDQTPVNETNPAASTTSDALDDDFDDFDDFQTGAAIVPPSENSPMSSSRPANESSENVSGGWSAFDSAPAEGKAESGDWAEFSEATPTSGVVVEGRRVAGRVRGEEGSGQASDQGPRHNLLSNASRAVTQAIASCFTQQLRQTMPCEACSLADRMGVKVQSTVAGLDQTASKSSSAAGAAAASSAAAAVDEVWRGLRVMEDTVGLRFSWGGSALSQRLLAALSIDARNILVGAKGSVPIFAPNLGLLEPNKSVEPLHARQLSPLATGDRTSGGAAIGLSLGTHAQDIPLAQFDWTSSGLTNPLDATSASQLDLDFFASESRSYGLTRVSAASAKERELLEALEAAPAPHPAPPKSSFELLLASMTSQSMTSQPPGAADRGRGGVEGREMSVEALRVLDALPDLGFMSARVLMFPLRGET